MGVSIRKYARLRGISDTAVHKALKKGRITTEPNGSIDVERANREWAANTTPQMSMKAAPYQAAEHTTPSSSDITAYMEAKTANEVLKAQTNQVKLEQLKSKLIDRDAAVAYVFRLVRQERDTWLTWPSRISSQMAAELEKDVIHQIPGP